MKARITLIKEKTAQMVSEVFPDIQNFHDKKEFLEPEDCPAIVISSDYPVNYTSEAGGNIRASGVVSCDIYLLRGGQYGQNQDTDLLVEVVRLRLSKDPYLESVVSNYFVSETYCESMISKSQVRVIRINIDYEYLIVKEENSDNIPENYSVEGRPVLWS